MEMRDACLDSEMCQLQSLDENLGLAFGLTIAAGLATTVGALLPFIPKIKQANTFVLSAGLALAAGFMLYVSFADIIAESTGYFCCVSPKHSYLAAVCCFFGGILLTVMLDILVHTLQKLDCGWKLPCGSEQRERFRALFKRQGNQDATVQMEKNAEEGVSVDQKEGDSVSPVDSGMQQEVGIFKFVGSNTSSGGSVGKD